MYNYMVQFYGNGNVQLFWKDSFKVMVMSNSLEGQFYCNGNVQLFRKDSFMLMAMSNSFWKDNFIVMVMSSTFGRTILW